MAIIPIIPLPLTIPLLDELFGGKVGILVIFLIVFAVISYEFVILVYLLVSFRRLNKSLALEIIVFPIIIFSAVWINFNLIDSQIDFIYWINESRQPENFHNPFLGFQMRDCRQISERFDFVFIPRSLSIETDYLAYAPKRTSDLREYRFAKKLNDNWYVENSGSMWSDDLRKCSHQSKIPF